MFPWGWIGILSSVTDASIFISGEIFPDNWRLRFELSEKSWLLPTINPLEILPVLFKLVPSNWLLVSFLLLTYMGLYLE